MVKALVAQTQPQLNGAHVAGIRHDLLHREATVRFVIVDGAARDLDGAHLAIDDLIRIGKLLLQGRRHGHDLEG